MRVLVTGGAGFIGSNLCRELAGDPPVQAVVALDDLSTGFEANLAGVDGVQLVKGSILDADLVDELVAASDTVIHLAARPSVPRSIADPRATHRVNVDGTFNILEAARHAGGRHIISASSSSVYGANPTLPKREDLAPMPMSPYAASKLSGEAYAQAYATVFGVDALVFRFFNVFGPRQAANHAYAAVLPAFVHAALTSQPLPVHGAGDQTRDFTFVGSVVSVIRDAVLRRVTHTGPVNLAFGNRISLLEVIDLLEAVLGVALPRAHQDPRPGDVKDSQADQTLLRSLFPEIQPVPLEAGLRETVAWYQQYNKSAPSQV
ncbi:MAG: NAD-dependent epimerase/dehydratase family protein [Actinomycetota bacterium]|nr:NAD-dependent epimerase/dehydratase family protein [Actinomycetota bacterium]